MVNDFWSSLAEWLKEKTSSPIWGVFIVAYVVCNWKKLYVLFWEYGAPTAGTRLEFLNNELFPFHGEGWQLYPSILGNWASELVLPIVITFFIIKYIPHIEKWAHDLHLYFYFERKKNFKKKELEYEKFSSQHIQNVLIEKEKQIESAQSVEELTKQINSLLSQVSELQRKESNDVISPDDARWEMEFERFGKSNIFKKFSQIVDAIYKHDGYVSTFDFELDKDILAFSHTNGLVEKDGNQITLSAKGKYFAKRYLENLP